MISRGVEGGHYQKIIIFRTLLLCHVLFSSSSFCFFFLSSFFFSTVVLLCMKCSVAFELGGRERKLMMILELALWALGVKKKLNFLVYTRRKHIFWGVVET